MGMHRVRMGEDERDIKPARSEKGTKEMSGPSEWEIIPTGQHIQ